MANQVDVTVNATTDADDVIDRVADSATQAGNQIQRAMGDSEQAFDSAARSSGRLGEKLDMASGASSQLSGGLGDVGGALTEAFGEDSGIGQFGAQMEKAGTIVMGFTGLMDLAMLANTAFHATSLRATASLVAHKVATVAGAAATGIATAAQWAWNAAFAGSGIGLIIIAVAALVAGIIYLATQTEFFQKLWEYVWNAVKVAFKATFDFVKAYYEFVFNALMGALNGIKNFFVSAFKYAIDFVVNYFQFIYSIPGKIANVFASVANAIFAPFRWAFNAIANFWNSTVGRLSFTIPDWVPGIGGNGFSMPRLPTYQTGGDIFRTGLAMVHKGERIIPASGQGLSAGGSTSRQVVEVRFIGAEGEFRRWMQRNTRVIGGEGPNSVQIAWGHS